MSEEFKEKRSFDDILWNTFIVIMVIFLGYALLLPRIRHVVDRIQGKKSAVVAKAAPPSPDNGPSASPAQSPDATSTPSPASTGDANSSAAANAPSANPAPSAADGPSTSASTAPHVTVNPPSETAQPTPKPKSSPAKNPATTSKPPVRAAPEQARYAVDAGSYTIRSNAERLVSEIPGKHQAHTSITPVKVRGKLFYRVRILVTTKAEADALSVQLLQKEKVHAVILALR